MSIKTKFGVRMGALKDVFCGDNLVGDFTEWCCTVVKKPEVEVLPDEADGRYTTLCWCCTFWRGVLVGGLAGVIVGVICG